MELIFTNPEQTTIKATLAEGETLGNHTGPVECFVPTDPSNKEYGEILEKQLVVADYMPPTAA